MLACEWCGQPTTRTEPRLCAECYFNYWTKTRMRQPDVGRMLLQRIAKLDCDACKLRTEQYIQSRDGVEILARCLKCGQVSKKSLLSAPQMSYPEDNRWPLYVL
jgi:NMD protein affecting ribosome stability and mRNA decay